MAQRISRAKATLRQHGARFEAPAPEELAERLHAVRQVLYLAFNEGYAATAGDSLIDVSVAGEAIRLTRMLGAPRPRPAAPTTRRPGCWR